MKLFIGLMGMTFAMACTDREYPQQIVRNQAAYDFDCSADQIKVAPLGNYRYTAEGCFKREVYVCSHGIFVTSQSVSCSQQLSSLPSLGDGSNAAAGEEGS